jgi:hypothetical protein
MPDKEITPGDNEFLKAAFKADQDCLLANLKSSNRIAHRGDRGEVNEQFFIDFLRAYLPDRYTIDKAMIIDSDGKVSRSIDVVVFDRHFTPTLLDNKKHRYVPAEAVYAVFECKPTINKEYLEYAGEMVKSVRALKRTSVPFSHIGGEDSAELFPIVGGILSTEVKWSDRFGKTFIKNHKAIYKNDPNALVDCGFAAEGGCFDVFSSFKTKKEAIEGDLSKITYEYGPKDNSLAFFAFRLLSKLRQAGSAPAADWLLYGKQLSE